MIDREFIESQNISTSVNIKTLYIQDISTASLDINPLIKNISTSIDIEPQLKISPPLLNITKHPLKTFPPLTKHQSIVEYRNDEKWFHVVGQGTTLLLIHIFYCVKTR